MLRKAVSKLHSESGIATLMAVGIVLVLTIVGFAIIARGANEQAVTVKSVDGSKALHVADAGVQQAIWRIKQNLLSEEDEFSVTLDSIGGTAEVSVDHEAGWYWTITSKGSVNNAYRTVKVTLFSFSLWDVDMSTGNTLGGGNNSGAINGNASFTGPLYVQGGLALSGDAVYEQGPLLIYAGSLQLGGSARAGSPSDPIEAYIHPISGYPPAYELRQPDNPINPDPVNGPFYASSLTTDVPLITLPPMEAMSTYRQVAYNRSVIGESDETVYPGIEWNVYEGGYGEKILDNNSTANVKPTGLTYYFTSATRRFGFDLVTGQRITGAAVDPSVGEMEAFGWDPNAAPGGTIYFSQSGAPMTVYVDGDLVIGDGPNDETFFKGIGTLVVNGDLTIHGRLVSTPTADFPVTNGIGMLVNGNITADSGGHNSFANPDYQGAWYAAGTISFSANNVGYVGTMMATIIDFEQNAHAWTHGDLSTNLPPSLPGANSRMTLMSGWREIIK
ncbi:MAG: hypothetical protein ACYC1U_00675 [Candidatus Aquicultorales bacterium]